jgi:hypothetical protein
MHKFIHFRPKSLVAWPLTILIALFAAAAFVRFPHRYRLIEASTTLQSGLKMDVRLQLRSAWGWSTPDHLNDLEVSFGGNDVLVPKEAFDGLPPLDWSQKPVIVEAKGFPEIILKGQKGTSLAEVRWRFLNYSFSERDLVQDIDHIDVTYYAGPRSETLQRPLALNISHTPDFSVTVANINPMPLKKGSK